MSKMKKDRRKDNEEGPKKGFLRRNWKRILLIVVAIGLMVYIIWKVDIEEIGHNLEGADFRVLALVVVLYFINLFTKAFRWQTLLGTGEEKGKVGYLRSLEYFTICLTINNVTPGRVGGEPVRAYLPHKGFGVSLGKGIATIFMEKCMDVGFTIVLVVVGAVFLFPQLPMDSIQGIIIGTLVIVLLFSIGLFIVFFREQLIFKKMIGIGITILRWIGLKDFAKKTHRSAGDLLEHFNDSLHIFAKNRATLVSVAALTMIIWLNEAFRLWLIMMALGLDVGLGSTLFVSSIATIAGVLVPLGIGNLISVAMILSLMGVGETEAATAGFLTTLTSIWLCVPIGALLIFITGIKPSAAMDKQTKESGQEPADEKKELPVNDSGSKKPKKQKKKEQ